MDWINHVLPAVVILACTRVCRSQCPHDARQEIMACIGRMGDFGFGFAGSGTDQVHRWDYDRTRLACETDSFHHTITCAEDVIVKCPHKNGQLREIIDIGNMRDAVEDMCSELEAMKPHVSCMHEQLNHVRRCARRQHELFNLKVKSAGADEDRRMEAICSFTNNVYGCQANPVRQHCGVAPAQFLLNFMSAFRPPSCPPPDGLNNSAPQFRTGNLFFVIWTSAFTIFVHSWTIFGS